MFWGEFWKMLCMHLNCQLLRCSPQVQLKSEVGQRDMVWLPEAFVKQANPTRKHTENPEQSISRLNLVTHAKE